MKFIILALCVAAVVADPHWLTLDPDELALIQDGWRNVYHNEVDILYFIFKANPDIQAKFPMFAGKDLETIKDTGTFALHAGRIVSFITENIELMALENTTFALKNLVNKMSQRHADRGVTKEQFNEFRVSFIDYLKAHVSWGDNVEYVWNKAFDQTYYIVFSNIDGHPVL